MPSVTAIKNLIFGNEIIVKINSGMKLQVQDNTKFLNSKLSGRRNIVLTVLFGLHVWNML